VIQEKRLDISFHIPHRSPSYLGLTVLFLFYFMACSTVSKIQKSTPSPYQASEGTYPDVKAALLADTL
jgi:hypothetical protein